MNQFISTECFEVPLKTVYGWICGFFCAGIAYFSDMQGAVHVMVAAAALDLISGIMASTIKKGEKFKMEKVRIAAYTAFAYVALVCLLFAMDREMNQDIASTYKIAAWIFSGFYAFSFADNMDVLLGGRIWRLLKGLLSKKIEEQTGVDINTKSITNE